MNNFFMTTRILNPKKDLGLEIYRKNEYKKGDINPKYKKK